MWSPQGDLFYRGINGRMMLVAPGWSADGPLTAPTTLFDATRYENWYDVAPDGKRLLMMPLVDNEREATQIRVVFDFLSELRQRVK